MAVNPDQIGFVAADNKTGDAEIARHENARHDNGGKDNALG